MTWFHSFTQGTGGGVAQPRLVEAEEDERVEAGKEKAVMEKERLGMEGQEGLMWGSRLEKNKNNTVALLLKSFCFTVILTVLRVSSYTQNDGLTSTFTSMQ